MKYKVGDRVMYADLSGIVTKTDEGHYFDILIKWDNGDKGWRDSKTISPDYRTLYERERELRLNLESIHEQKDLTIDEWMAKWNHYQQLKQQYGQDTGRPR